MSWFLFILYTSILSIFLYKSKLFTQNGKRTPYILPVFLVKVLFGVIYLYLYQTRFGGGDTWSFFDDAVKYKNLLGENPRYFFKFLLGSFYPFGSEGFEAYISDCYNCKYSGNMFVIRFNLILLFISGGYYYIHALFMAFVLTLGYNYLYKCVMEKFQGGALFYTFILSLPLTFLFHTSGIHKDGFIYLFLMLLVYCIFKLQDGWTKKHLIGLITFIFLIGIVRLHLLSIILPLVAASLMTIYKRKNIFTMTLAGIFALGFVLLKFMPEDKNILNYIVMIKVEFDKLGGGSHFETPKLQANLWSVIMYLPTAIKNGFFRPFISDGGDYFKILASIEVWTLTLFSIVAFVFKRKAILRSPVYSFLLYFGWLICILDGYILSNSGVLIRYRSVGYSFLLIYMAVAVLDINRIKSAVGVGDTKD